MSYSDLKKLKAEQAEQYTRNFCPYIVVGEGLNSLAIYHHLVKKHGENSVKFICKKEDVSKNEFLLRGPSKLRGEANVNAVKQAYPELEIIEKTTGASFLKEGNFREFGGRSKGEPLQWGEGFYSGKGYSFDLEKVYTVLEDEEFFQSLNEKRSKLEIEKLVRTNATDLVDQNNWSLYCANGELWQCQDLFWGRSPDDFLELYGNKNELSNDFIEFCESTKAPNSLYIKLVYEKPVSDLTNTLFIPLSYTHEWGHFIGEFTNENDQQVIDFLTHIDPDHNGEEELSKKIRLIKKNMEKNFEASKKISCQEFIQLTVNTPCQKVDDSTYAKVKDEFKNLFFTGNNAPLNQVSGHDNTFEDSFFVSTHTARALLNWSEFVRTF